MYVANQVAQDTELVSSDNSGGADEEAWLEKRDNVDSSLSNTFFKEFQKVNESMRKVSNAFFGVNDFD